MFCRGHWGSYRGCGWRRCRVAGAVYVRRDGEDCGVDVGGVVAELEEEGCCGRVGHGEGVAGVTIGDGLGVGEGRAGGDLCE